MRIGIFDSGLGGVLIAKAIRGRMPNYDYLFLGDTLHVPYGKRSTEAITRYTTEAVDWLFRQDCRVIIVACNTASAAALRTIQQTWLPAHYPDRRVLGVVVPTLEEVSQRGFKRVGLIGTDYTIGSKVYEEELRKLSPDLRLFQKATPLLVPLIEHDGLKWAKPILADYLTSLSDAKIEALILGCTHYSAFRPALKDLLPGVALFAQDEIVPLKLEDYLRRHPEHESVLTRGGKIQYCLTELTDSYRKTFADFAGEGQEIRKVDTGA